MELQRVRLDRYKTDQAEDILGQLWVKGKKQVLVHWKNWIEKFNSWVNASDMKCVQKRTKLNCRTMIRGVSEVEDCIVSENPSTPIFFILVHSCVLTMITFLARVVSPRWRCAALRTGCQSVGMFCKVRNMLDTRGKNNPETPTHTSPHRVLHSHITT